MNRRPILLSFLLSAAFVVLAFLMALPVLASTSTLFGNGNFGADISYPNKATYPTAPSGTKFTFGILGVTGGKAFSTNSYLGDQYKNWVLANSLQPSLYMNLNYPVGSSASNGLTGPKGKCARKDKACQAYNYGYNAAANAYTYASDSGVNANIWWLDIETANSWSPTTSLNDQVIQGATDYFKGQGATVGIYSTASMWNKIAGKSYKPGLVNWIPESAGSDAATMSKYCGSSSSSFGGGSVGVVQYYTGSYDLDYACQ